jgi:chemotaxis signal transduction protein
MLDLPPLSTQSRRGSAQNDLRLVAFKLGPTVFGVDVEDVHAIYHALPLIPVRQGESKIEGYLSLSGGHLPVVDLRRFTELPVQSHYKELIEWIVVVNCGAEQVGFIVDEVTEVLKLEASALQKTIASGAAAVRFPVRAVARANGQEILIPDLSFLISEVTN